MVQNTLMSPAKVLLTNKTLAVFMGANLLEDIETALIKDIGGVPYSELAYERSWDMLVPVIEKLESMGCVVTITQKNCKVQLCRYPYYSTQCQSNVSKIDATYKAIADFINSDYYL